MSDFDEGVDALGIAEEHAADVLSLEEDQAGKLMDVYSDVARNLRRRLRRMPPDSFSAQQMRVTLLMLDAALRVFQADLASALDIGATLLAEEGVEHLIGEVDAFNDYFRGSVQLANVDLAVAALDAKNFLMNRYQVSVEAYSNGLRSQIASNIQAMLVERTSAEEIHRRMVADDGIGKFFDGEAWRLRRIVRTELHNMYGIAKVTGLEHVVDNYEPAMRKALYHPMDSRTADDSMYVETLKLRPRVDEHFEYVWQARDKNGNPTGRAYTRRFMAPPDRPNDRAILIPFHPSWDRG